MQGYNGTGRFALSLCDLGVHAEVVEGGQEVEVEFPDRRILCLGRTERMPTGAKKATLGSEFEPLRSALSQIGAAVKQLDGAFFVQVPTTLGHPTWKILDARQAAPVRHDLIGVPNDPDELESVVTGR